jgi:hypothetical protein
MIFDQAQWSAEKQDRSAQRLCQLARLIAVFEASFPSVQYRLLNSVTAINAQASFANGSRLVDIFGGLAFHPVIGHDGLVFMLLHETGHHLSRGCRLPWAELACECSADSWATAEGHNELQANGEDFRLHTALEEIEQAVNLQAHEISSTSATRARCWAMNWQKRKQALLDSRATRLKTCQISSAIKRSQTGGQNGRIDS